MNASKTLSTTVGMKPAKRSEDEILPMLLSYRANPKESIRERIVLQFTNLVESIARRFSGSAEPFEDLVQEGYIGLITAIDLYDPSKNVKFSTYATHFVIGQIKHHLRDRGKIIKEPAWLQELNQRVSRVRDALTNQLNRLPSNLEIAKTMDMTEDAISELLMTREVFKVISIDHCQEANDDNFAVVDMERQQASDVAMTFQLPVEERIVLETALKKLKDLEQKVIIKFYYNHLNQAEIARQLGLSSNYVSHILRNSTRKLKKILTTDDLQEAQLRLASMRGKSDVKSVEMEPRVQVDSLTRLYNRYYFENRLEEEALWASREGDEVSILFISIGDIRGFSNRCGTLRADEVVQGVVQTITSSVRRSDILTRFNENTFALILPHTGQNAVVVKDRLYRTLGEWFESVRTNIAEYPLLLNIGVAVYAVDASTAKELIAIASERASQMVMSVV